MEALILPKTLSTSESAPPSFIDDLSTALETWHRTNGGLRQLKVPWLPQDEIPSLLRIMISFCPKIEYLQSDSLKQESAAGNWSRGPRFFDVPIDMWREFCERCSSLRELDWSLVPRSKEYDQVFSARTWPKLESLTIGIRHVRGRRGSQPLFDASEFGLLLEALPALRSLKLHVVGAERYANGSDGFLKEVIKRCPHLETFSFHPDILSREGLPSGAIWSTLLAMPRVVDLEVCKLVDVNGSSLVNTLLLSPVNLRRHVCLEVNGLVHAAVVKMLQFLDSEDSDRLTQLRISIQVNASRRNYDPSHSHPATSMTITQLENMTDGFENDTQTPSRGSTYVPTESTTTHSSCTASYGSTGSSVGEPMMADSNARSYSNEGGNDVRHMDTSLLYRLRLSKYELWVSMILMRPLVFMNVSGHFSTQRRHIEVARRKSPSRQSRFRQTPQVS